MIMPPSALRMDEKGQERVDLVTNITMGPGMSYEDWC